LPSKGYYIVGSWSDSGQALAHPSLMKEEEPGVHTSIVMLGENRWEQFQIWLDGDPSRVLHPGQCKAPSDTAVFGPSDGHGFQWMLDGREGIAYSSGESKEADSSLVRLGQAEMSDPLRHGCKAVMDLFSTQTPWTGTPGDLYRIELLISGRWRTVRWAKYDVDVAEQENILNLVLGSSMTGRYFIVASWTDWNFEEMCRNDSDDMWFVDVVLSEKAEFQIVRNRDWGQTIYPSEPHEALSHETLDVLGPDDMGHGLNWSVKAGAGVARIEFRRTHDMMNVSWRQVDAPCHA